MSILETAAELTAATLRVKVPEMDIDIPVNAVFHFVASLFATPHLSHPSSPLPALSFSLSLSSLASPRTLSHMPFSTSLSPTCRKSLRKKHKIRAHLIHKVKFKISSLASRPASSLSAPASSLVAWP